MRSQNLISKFKINLTIGYNDQVKQTPVSHAASLLGKRSAQARKAKWGEEEFLRRMRKWGKLGGRPKNIEADTSKPVRKSKKGR